MMRLALIALVFCAAVSADAGPSRGYTSTTIFGNRETEDNLPSSFYEPLKPAKKTSSKKPSKPKPKSSQQVIAAPQTKPKAPPTKIDVTKEASDKRLVAKKTETKDKESSVKSLEAKTVFVKPPLSKTNPDPLKTLVNRNRSKTILELAPKYKARRHGFADWP